MTSAKQKKTRCDWYSVCILCTRTSMARKCADKVSGTQIVSEAREVQTKKCQTVIENRIK